MSCYNREREVLVGKNGKGTTPIMHPPLHRRSITYWTGGQLKTRTFDLSVDMDELIVAVLRDSKERVRFVPTTPSSML